LFLCVQNLVANIPAAAAVAVAAASADIVVVAVASVVAAAFGNVEISCFRQAQPLRRIPANPTKLPDKLRERERAKTKRALRPGGHRNFESRERATFRESERDRAGACALELQMHCMKIRHRNVSSHMARILLFFWLVSYFLQLCC